MPNGLPKRTPTTRPAQLKSKSGFPNKVRSIGRALARSRPAPGRKKILIPLAAVRFRTGARIDASVVPIDTLGRRPLICRRVRQTPIERRR